LVLAFLLIAVVFAQTCNDQFLTSIPKTVTPLKRPSKPYGYCHYNNGVNFFYTLYDEYVLHSNWVAYRLTQANMKKAEGGRRSFKTDPYLTSRNITQVQPNAPGIGYGDKWNRGHLGPSKAFSWDKSTLGPWEQCYYTTNIAPQAYKVNQQGWKNLEAYVYNWTLTRPAGGSLYVITGTHYVNKNVTWIPGNLGVPDYYYKVICDGRSSAGFLAKNVLASSGEDAYDFRTVKSVQDLTGIDFGWSSKCNIGAVNRSYWGW